LLSILRRWPLQAVPIKALLALLDQVLVSGPRFIATLLIGRYCGAEELGLYSLVFSALIMLIVVQESLVTTPYTMLYHRARARRLRIATNSWRYCLIWSLGSAALLGFVALVVNWKGQPQLFILFLAMLLSAPFVLQREFARRFSLAALKIKQALSLNVTAALFQVGLLVTLLSIGWLNAY
jgi:O-antigen/teichoic acid export membrane protein